MGGNVDSHTTRNTRMTSSNAHNGDNKLTDTHTRGTDEEKAPTTDTIDKLYANDRHYSVNHIGNDRDDESIRDASLLEERLDDIIRSISIFAIQNK